MKNFDQELDTCYRVYEVATYNKRRVCVIIKKYSVNKLPYLMIRLFTTKKYEGSKQVAYVNYNLNDFEEFTQTFRDFLIVGKGKVQ